MHDREVGEYVDISHVNRKRATPVVQKKSSFQEATEHLFEVGTKFISQNGKMARRIPVVYS